MNHLYKLFIFLFGASIRLSAHFNSKSQAFLSGRENLLNDLASKINDDKSPLIWIHCASLGEFEQGRPIIEKLKTDFPAYKILLTFFSPSGYEVQKNYVHADYVFYLPLDTESNAQQFISITKPVLAIFVKYEFWHFFCHELKKKNIPLISISSIFRPDQLYFKPWGKFYKNILYTFDHFFVQNEESVELLKSINITNCTLAGDTRFDRVYQIVEKGDPIPIAEKFKNDEKVFVIGSCWEDDMEVLIPFINDHVAFIKFIIAPHEITEDFISHIENSINVNCVRYSTATHIDTNEYRVLIIDNVGMLSRLYRYGEFAFVGGGFSVGLHNILEAACYGIPIFFGNRNYQKYEEANQLINRGGAFEVADFPDLKKKYDWLSMPNALSQIQEITRGYVEENLGATEKIMTYCKPLLEIKNKSLQHNQ